jgi:hypothetical protein
MDVTFFLASFHKEMAEDTLWKEHGMTFQMCD